MLKFVNIIIIENIYFIIVQFRSVLLVFKFIIYGG